MLNGRFFSSLLAGITLATLTQSGCVVTTEDLATLSYDPSSDYRGGNNRDAYRQGYDLGRRDASSGRPEDFSRHSGNYGWSQLAEFRDGYRQGYENYTPMRSTAAERPSNWGPVTASVGQGQVQILQGGRTLSVIRTAMPSIEDYHFTDHHQKIVVKSRGNHGPATVELFDCRTGALRDKVLAYAIQNGRPKWARGMQD